MYKPELSHLFHSEMFERMGMRLSHEISKSNRFVCQISNNSVYSLYKNLLDFILYTFMVHQGALKLSSVYLDWGGVLKKLKLFKMWNKFNEDLYLLLKKLRLQSFKTMSLFSYIFHRRSMYFILLLFFAFPLCKANACSCCCCLSFWHICRYLHIHCLP